MRLRRWTLAWLGGSVLGIVNGVVREALYKDRVGTDTANQISAGSLIALLAAYFWMLERREPLPDTRTAFEVGGIWTVLTVVFEFGFGHYVDRKSWAELRENYDPRSGNLWLLVLLWIAAGPESVRRLSG